MSRRVYSQVRAHHSRSSSNWTWRSGYRGGELLMQTYDSKSQSNKTQISCHMDVDGNATIKVSRNAVVIHEVVIGPENPSAVEKHIPQADVKVP